jgi:hypothetical protein
VITDEQSKAIAEGAKLGKELIKAGERAGGYLAKVLASIPENLLGLAVEDWLEHRRRRHLALLQVNTQRILDSIERERITDPSPALLLPILKIAADESREELQVSTITLFDGVAVAYFNGLPASASRWL